MSEAELHLIRSRLTAGLRAKAARGELRQGLPAGLDYDDGDHVIITPDEAVARGDHERVPPLRPARLGPAGGASASAMTGCCCPGGDIRTGKITWAQAGYPAVHDILIHPGYAGVFAYGRSTHRKAPRRRRDRDHPAAAAAPRPVGGDDPRPPSRLHLPGSLRRQHRQAGRQLPAARAAARRRRAGRRGLAAGPAALRPVRAAHAGRLPLRRQPRLPVRPRQPDVRRQDLPADRRTAAARDGAGRAARRARPRLPGRHRPGHGRRRSPAPPEPGRVRTRRWNGPATKPAGRCASTTTSSRRTGWSPGPWRPSWKTSSPPCAPPKTSSPPSRPAAPSPSPSRKPPGSPPPAPTCGPSSTPRPPPTPSARNSSARSSPRSPSPCRTTAAMTPPGRARSRSSGKAAPAPSCRCRCPPAATTAASPAKTPST